jgi:hypothetical protein
VAETTARRSPDDDRVSRAFRELLHRSGKTMMQVSREANISLPRLRRLARADLTDIPIGTVRRAFEVFDARLRVSVYWRGADLDRILDEAHARIVEGVVAILKRYGWSTAVEVTFSEYGERGSIDVLGLHRATLCAVVAEIKASWGSLEETNRSLDVKVRLGAKLVEERFGVRPLSVSNLLVFPDDRTLRRVAARHEHTLATAYPLRSREVRSWLRSPTRRVSGLWFLSNRSNPERE